MRNENHDFKFDSPLENTTKESKTKIERDSIETKNDSSESAQIIYIDDEEDLCDVVKLQLEDLGHNVQCYTSGEDFIKNFSPQSVDIIITDYNMPVMNGIDLIKKVHTIDTQIPIIVLSGLLSTEVCISANNNGAYALLSKPLNIELIDNTISNAFQYIKLTRLVDRSLKLLMFQFSDLKDFLKVNGKEHTLITIQNEIETLYNEKNKLKDSLREDKTSPR